MTTVATVRDFNRRYTQWIGVLSDSYLGVGRPLGPSRLLFELGDGPERVGDLRRRLGLDSGYLSRMLRQLEAEHLVTVRRDPRDGRQRLAELTDRGRHEWQRLDHRSQRAATELIEPLSARQRSELDDALASAARLLRLAALRFDEVGISSPDAAWAVDQYFAEIDQRFDTGFDPGAGGADHDADAMTPPRGTFLVVRSDGDVVGCGGLQRVDDATGEIKRMWIHPDWRGQGIARRLLAELVASASSVGCRRVVLDTNRSLTEAVALYESAGFHRIERYNDNPYAHHWFGLELD